MSRLAQLEASHAYLYATRTRAGTGSRCWSYFHLTFTWDKETLTSMAQYIVAVPQFTARNHD
jgi:hypothetical protein